MSKKILIVEDEPDIMALATVRLKHSGYEVICANDAEEGLAWLQDNIPDLILLNLFLPKMQGEEFCKMLKKDDKFKKIPIILFTAGSSSSTPPEKIKDIGAEDCIFKPYKPQEILSKVKKYLGE